LAVIQEEQSKVALEVPKKNIPKYSKAALRSARKKLKRLEREVARLSKDQITAAQLSELAELREKIQVLQSQRALLLAPATTAGAKADTANVEPAEVEKAIAEPAIEPVVVGPAVPEPARAEPAKPEKLPLSKLAKNVWFLRSLILISGTIAGTLLLIYDFIFLATYNSYGNTTSYFPWAWNAFYFDYGKVEGLFYIALAISLATIVACGVTLILILPKVRAALSAKPLTAPV
jgi:TolA-binding protein